MTHSIGIIGGDGIGPEVVAEALKVVDATGVAYEPVAFDLGGARYLRTGEVLPDEVLGEIGDLDAVLLGQGSVNTRHGVERCLRFAFGLAQGRPRKHLTLVHKTNVLTFAGDLWQRCFDELGPEYADVTRGYDHVDAACIHLVERPDRYDVIVTDNLFGDILTDLAGAVSGGIGRAASANLNPARTGPSVFEPVHGSAPDIAGTGQADPRAAIISVAMLLEFLGETEAAARVEKAVAASDDVSGTTSEIGDAIAGKV